MRVGMGGFALVEWNALMRRGAAARMEIPGGLPVYERKRGRPVKLRPAPVVAAVHDLSCVGRCALTVVLPTLAVMGVQGVPLPTAVLSTHTGGFTDLAAQTLDGFMGDCVAHWKALRLKLDAVYSGYLATVAQVDLVHDLIGYGRDTNGALAVVDPVMGDEGELYSAIPRDMPAAMKTLCDAADLITPNLTEAALMLDRPYREDALTNDEIYDMLRGFDARHTVITSVTLGDGRPANVYRTRGENGFWICPYRRVPVHYPGTGDLFASVLTGALVRGDALHDAVALASEHVRRVMEESSRTEGEPRYGVQLERTLGWLVHPAPAEYDSAFVPM